MHLKTAFIAAIGLGLFSSCGVRIGLGPVSFGTGPGPAAQGPGSPSPLGLNAESLTPQGNVLVDTVQTDLNLDGRADYILVLEPKAMETGMDDFRLDRRAVVLLTQKEDGQFREADRNELILMCSDCGSSLDDPYSGIEARPGAFVLKMKGSSERESWERRLSFKFHRKKKFWYLSHDETIRFDSSGKQSGKSVRKLSRREALSFGKVEMFSEE